MKALLFIAVLITGCQKPAVETNFVVEIPGEIKIEGKLDGDAKEPASLYQRMIAGLLGAK